MTEAAAPTKHASPAADVAAGGDGIVVEVIAEELAVGKREEVTARVAIDKRVALEPVRLDLERVDRRYDVTRRPVGTLSDTPPPATRREGDAVVYSVVREVPVVVTRYELVEEVVVTPRVTVTPEPTVVHRRVERVAVERTPTHATTHNQPKTT